MERKFIVFVLILSILIPMAPKPVAAKGLVKEIDAVYNNFKLQVEGKTIPHKDVFIHNGELWVPIKDIGRALEIGVSFNPDNRILYLNSYGKLNISNESSQNIAYQKGYEVQAKDRIVANLHKEIQAFEGKTSSSSSTGEALVRNIQVGFSNIKTYLDGKEFQLEVEPLIYNDDLYMSLVDLSPVLYIFPSIDKNIINIDANSILVKKDGFSSTEQLANFRQSLNNILETQLAQIEKRKNIIMNVKIPYENIESLNNMERYLNKHLGEIEDLPINISLNSGSNNSYYLDIEFSSRHTNRWRSLSRRDVENHIWDIFVAITNLYDKDAKIEGNIKNPNYSSSYRVRHRNYVEFHTKIRNLVFSFINSDLDMTEKVDPLFIEELLAKELGRFNREDFSYSVRISGYDLELLVTPSSSDYMRKWSSETKLRFLREISYEIGRYYPGLKVNGKVQYDGEETIQFLIDDGKLSSPNIVNEMVDYLNDRYDIFRTGGLRIPMKYGFHQVDLDNYNLLIDMDFDRNNSAWDQAGEEALNYFLQDIVKDIVSLWDVNIFAQVYDKNQSLVNEFVVSQDTVQAVTSSPISGNIEEGKSVSLHTNTSGADIYYTMDGTNPSSNNRTLYTKPIVINEDTTIKAYAVKRNFNDSPVYEFKYTIVTD